MSETETKKSRNLYSIKKLIATRTTKFGKFSLDSAIFSLKNIETTEFRNKIEIDESER